MAEHRVVRLHGVALGKKEAVALGVLELVGPHVHDLAVEQHERVDHTHVAADMPAAACDDDVDGVLAQLPAQLLKVLCHLIPLVCVPST